MQELYAWSLSATNDVKSERPRVQRHEAEGANSRHCPILSLSTKSQATVFRLLIRLL